MPGTSAGGPAFGSLYAHGFVRVAAGVTQARVADPEANAVSTLEVARRASVAGAAIVVFPELGLSAYTNEDLFHQEVLTDATLEALAQVVEESRTLAPVLVVGSPLRIEQKLFNCGVVVHRGKILGAVPKSYLPQYREFYEKRQFAAARDAIADTAQILGATVPFGPDLLFTCSDLPAFVVAVEVCEDVWVPVPPSSWSTMAGATVVVNLSASDVTIGKPEYRRELCMSQSARTICAYAYTAAGAGESTTDLAWDGHALIAENGMLLVESQRFSDDEQLVTADVDVERLVDDRMRMTSFTDSVHDNVERLRAFRRVPFELGAAAIGVPLERHVERFPYVPADPVSRAERCSDVYNIQVQGLTTRLRATGIEKVVIGVSGGLDSTQALIVSTRAMDHLGFPRTNVLAYTMPGFATSARTLDNARKLMAALRVCAHEIDIRPSSQRLLEDIGHPAAAGAQAFDRTYENVQAGERTSHLFRLANMNEALVVGTGDLSELALGWSTYGVGDQMSHYNVNVSVPKTLVQFLIRWVIDAGELGDEAGPVLQSVLDTEISPELIPGTDGGSGQPAHLSESVVGPYELQDFFLYNIVRFGLAPSKVAYLAHHAWHDRTLGAWPDLIPQERRNEYTLADIKRWLRVFLVRFFQTSQFKRSALPNGPKVGSGGSLSPRGDWRAPSDSSADVWLAELDARVPDSV